MSSNEPTPVTVQRAWSKVMTNMGSTNLQRVADARKAANALKTLRRGR